MGSHFSELGNTQDQQNGSNSLQVKFYILFFFPLLSISLSIYIYILFPLQTHIILDLTIYPNYIFKNNNINKGRQWR